MSASEPRDIGRLSAALASLAEQPEWPEPDADRIFAALHGDLGPEERRAVVDEMIRNPRAALAWRLAHELAPEGASHLAVARLAMTRRLWTWAAAAAAAMVLIVVGVGSQLRFWHPADAPVYRSAESRRIASLLPAGKPLARAQPILRWTPVEGARYRVRVLTSNLELLEEAEDIAAPEYRVSPDAVRRVPPGGRLLWQVEARVPGSAPVTSPTFSARVE
jgi:hypothetical protein